jgi:hypothetical protein
LLPLGLAGRSAGWSEWPKPVSVKILPYNASEHGKFVEVCLDRPLQKEERYEFEFQIETKHGTRQQCSGSFADAYRETPKKCKRYNMFVHCQTKRFDRAERGAMAHNQRRH